MARPGLFGTARFTSVPLARHLSPPLDASTARITLFREVATGTATAPFFGAFWQPSTGLSRNGVYGALQAGKIPGAVQVGRRWLIPADAADRLLSGGTVHQGGAATTTEGAEA